MPGRLTEHFVLCQNDQLNKSFLVRTSRWTTHSLSERFAKQFILCQNVSVNNSFCTISINNNSFSARTPDGRILLCQNVSLNKFLSGHLTEKFILCQRVSLYNQYSVRTTHWALIPWMTHCAESLLSWRHCAICSLMISLRLNVNVGHYCVFLSSFDS